MESHLCLPFDLQQNKCSLARRIRARAIYIVVYFRYRIPGDLYSSGYQAERYSAALAVEAAPIADMRQ